MKKYGRIPLETEREVRLVRMFLSTSGIMFCPPSMSEPLCVDFLFNVKSEGVETHLRAIFKELDATLFVYYKGA